MKSSLFAGLIGSLVLVAAMVASAEEGGSSSSLNPFAFKRQKKAPVSARATDSSSGWKFPRLWPGKSATAQRKPAAPSTWQKMTSGTKNLISQTADTLNPFNDANDHAPEPTITGRNSMFSQASSTRKPEETSKSFLPSWQSSEEKQPTREKSGDVKEFLALPRPGF